MINSTTFVEGTWGFIRNELTGGNEGGVLINESSNRLKDLPGFPMLYPDAGKVNNDNYYVLEVMNDVGAPWWDKQNSMINLPPVFGWGSRIGAAPPNQRYPGWLNINRTNDVSVSLTKVMGSHTIKAGFYNNHSFKAQNTGRRRHRQPHVPGLRELRQRHQQRPRYGLRVCERGDRRVHAVPAGLRFHRRPHGLRQHGVLRPGQLEGEQQADRRLRYAVYAAAAAARPVPADVELLPRTVVAVAGTAPVCRRLQQRGDSVLREYAKRDGSRYAPDPDRTWRGQHAGRDRHADSGHRQPAQWHQAGGRRHRGDRVHLADDGLRATFRHGVRLDRKPGHHPACRRGRVLRPAGRQHGLLDSRQPAARDGARPSQRAVADAGAGSGPGSAFRR